MVFDRDRVKGIAADPIAHARVAREQTGRPVIATLSSWAPHEVIEAAGGTEVRLPAPDGGAMQGNRARAHLQAASCFLCQGALEAGLDGSLDFVDAVLFVQTCDAQQNLSDIFKIAVPSIPVLDMYMPVNRTSRGAAAYLEKEIERVCRDLGAITGKTPGPDELGSALDARREQVDALSALYGSRIEADGLVPAMDFYSVCVASSCLPPSQAAPIARSLVEDIRSKAAVRECPVERSCMLVGSTLPYPGLYELFDRIGVAVRDDDLSLGRRLFDHPVPAGGSPVERIARGMLDRSSGATKFDDGLVRGSGLLRAARRAGVKHVVMPVLKFCDPWAWDFPAVRDRLEAAGMGMLLLELAGGEDLAAGTIRNRVEAYFEMGSVGDLFDG